MSGVNNIPTGLLVPAQVPLDAKRVVLTNTILQDLGVDDHLAFTYEDGLIVFSVATRERWEWRERKTPIEEDISLLLTDFIYPDNHVIAGIDYSLKSYNFFLKREVLPMINLGTGKKVYKGINVVNEKHEFYTLETDGKITLSYPEISGTETGVLLFTFPGFENYSTNGTPIFKGYESVGNKFQFYTIDSEDIKIEVTPEGVITLSLPETSSVPSIYVNQDYIPTYDDWFKANRSVNGTPIPGFQYKGEGTLAKPFTDTCTYTIGNSSSYVKVTANSSIQNGVNDYLGSGGRLNPTKLGQKIQILNSTLPYFYDGDFSFKGLNLEIYGYVITETSNELVNMDNPSHFPSATNVNTTARIYMHTESILEIKGKGFWNSGHNISTINYTFSKTMYLEGDGEIISVNLDITKYIINSGITYPTHNNAGFLNFEISCPIFCKGQGIIQNGGLGRVECKKGAFLNSGTLTDNTDIDLEAFKITGGFVRMFDCTVSLVGLNVSPDRKRGFSLEKSGNLDVLNGPQIYMVNVSLRGHVKTWFDRKGQAAVVILSNCSSVYFAGENLITSTGNSAVWGNIDTPTKGYVSLKNNTFDGVKIDTKKIDLTINGYQAVTNTIGQDVIQSLRIFPSKQRAKLSSYNLPPGAVFIKRSYINDSSLFSKFKIGDTFTIASQSTPLTDFIPIHFDQSLAPITNVEGDHIAYNGNLGLVPSFDSSSGVILHYDEICIMT